MIRRLRPARPTRRLAAAALVAALACVTLATMVRPAPAEPSEGSFVSLDELKPGDRCIGRTVFSGTDVQEFQLEIIGIVRGTSPGSDLIIGEAEGEVLEETGILEGMSGSPVYLDGRLVGAVASTWQFATRPIAGITPIAEMLPALEMLSSDRYSDAGANSGAGRLPASLDMIPQGERENSAGVRLAEAAGLLVTPGDGAGEGAGVMFGERRLTPIAAPLVVSGASDDFLKATTRLFGSGVAPMPGAAPGAVAVSASGSPTSSAGSSAAVAVGGSGAGGSAGLVPGSSVGVQFIRGDANWTAIGTVTYVDGDRLVAFGHPLFNSGEMDMPMVTAPVHALMPMQSISFKYASGGELVGAFRQDRSRAVAGLIGPEPRMVPVSALVHTADGDHRFELEVVRGRPYTSVFSGLAVGSALSSVARQSGPATVELTATLDLRGGPVVYRDVFQTSEPAMRVSGEISMLLTVLLENAFEEVDLTNVDIDLVVSEGKFWTAIERVDSDRAVYRPGDDVHLRVHLRPRRGEPFERDVSLRIPESAPDGTLTLRVADASTYHLLEQDRLGPGMIPRTFRQLLDLVRTARSGSTVIAQLLSDVPGFSLAGEEMRAVPGRAGLAMAGSSAGGVVDSALQSVLAEKQFEIDGQAVGYFETTITVMKDRRAAPK